MSSAFSDVHRTRACSRRYPSVNRLGRLMKRRAVTRLQTRTYALRLVTSEANLPPIFDFAGCFDVNKMFINTVWKLFNVHNTRRICVTFVRVETIKTARTNYECWGEYRKAPCLTCIPSRNTTSPETTSTTFDVGTIYSNPRRAKRSRTGAFYTKVTQ